jgi:hypothetical protein
MKLTPIEILARGRAAAAELAGRSAFPWLDPERDLVLEAAEELADALNYLVWSIIKRNNRREEEALLRARDQIIAAYADLNAAAQLREEGSDGEG